ncbi:MAG: 50S ribosomal protein L19e [archaeon]
MKLDKKRRLASRMLDVGYDRIWFNPERLTDIKEAITKQDLKDLIAQKIIKIKEISGTKKKKKRKTRRRDGSFSKKVSRAKEMYVNKIRKLRKYLKGLKMENKLTSEQHKKMRRYAKSGVFRDMKHMKEYIKEMTK